MKNLLHRSEIAVTVRRHPATVNSQSPLTYTARSGGRRTWLVALSLLFAAPSMWGQRDRLSSWIYDHERVTLRGSVHPLAKPEFDLGAADPYLQLDSMILGLKKTEQQQAELDQLVMDVQDPKSPLYHQWLTPEQFAERFGISQNDIDKISAWLEWSGFKVLSVGRGRDMIRFSGTASQVERALHTPIHRYKVNGEEHYAAAAAPSIPQDMADLVIDIHGLNDFKPKPPTRRGRIGTISEFLAAPQFRGGDGNNYLAPEDVAIIYNLAPVYEAGIDGAGQVIAVAGQSDIDMADVEAFRKAFNLPLNNPEKVLVPQANNPGQNGSLGEANLDLEWAGAIAPKARLVYVFSPSALLSAIHAIDEAVAPVLSLSAGLCEWHFTENDAAFLRHYSQRSAIQGITWVVASGDSGAAGCEDHNGRWAAATTRMSVNMFSALPEVTAVGGTEFTEGQGSYWSSKASPNNGNALSYIPESCWNDEGNILQEAGNAFPGTAGRGFASGGGGASRFWGKPRWQAGPGVPDDGARDVPDVSLTASWDHDPYILFSGGDAHPSGGTSASAPVFAGILALLNDYLVRTKVQSRPGLGNINPMLYFLGQNAPDVYHDITAGSNAIPCVPGSSQDCGKDGIYGYSAGPGYDLATGWGSVDATKFIATWGKVANQAAKLVITSFTLPAQVAAGGQVTVVVKTQNQGKTDAGPFQVRILFTADGTQATAKPWFISCDLKAAAVDQTVTCSGTVTLDQSITPGTYFPLAIADYAYQLVQSDRTGNFAYTSSHTMIVK